ncbi:MAG: hypothetical protein ACREM3_17265 [Candidatus Rokuibacteriota bacterium]
MRPKSSWCALGWALTALAFVGLVLAAGSVPHTHAGNPGLYNQEHDLGYLATFGHTAPLPESPAALLVVVAAEAAVAALPGLVTGGARRHPDSRAPPTR